MAAMVPSFLPPLILDVIKCKERQSPITKHEFESSLHTIKLHNLDENCSICLNILGDEVGLAKSTVCSNASCVHIYHRHCLLRWASTKQDGRISCPQCRSPWFFEDHVLVEAANTQSMIDRVQQGFADVAIATQLENIHYEELIVCMLTAAYTVSSAAQSTTPTEKSLATLGASSPTISTPIPLPEIRTCDTKSAREILSIIVRESLSLNGIEADVQLLKEALILGINAAAPEITADEVEVGAALRFIEEVIDKGIDLYTLVQGFMSGRTFESRQNEQGEDNRRGETLAQEQDVVTVAATREERSEGQEEELRHMTQHASSASNIASRDATRAEKTSGEEAKSDKKSNSGEEESGNGEEHRSNKEGKQ